VLVWYLLAISCIVIIVHVVVVVVVVSVIVIVVIIDIVLIIVWLMCLWLLLLCVVYPRWLSDLLRYWLCLPYILGGLVALLL
jgi:hypothetical protein